MQLTVEHFQAARSGGAIHLFWEPQAARSIELAVQGIARALSFHYVLLPGHTTRDGARVRERLGAAYEFPHHRPGHAETWDGVVDWLRDLTWLTSMATGPERYKGFILLYRDPVVLFNNDAYEFAVLLDVLGHIGDRLGGDRPFHVVLGPLSDRRLSSFITLLTVSENYCPLCQYP